MNTPPVEAQASTPEAYSPTEPAALHGRNGQRPGGEHIADGAAAHGTHQAGGEDGNLGRAAAQVPEQRECQINKERTTAGVLQ